MSESMRTWQARAEAILAQSCLTYSKSRRYYVEAQPSHVTEASGEYLIDPAGNMVLDTVSGLGANLIDIKNSYSLPATLEV
jgi:4-aminobutyrate aminotransferase-like enzyme